MKLSDLAHLIRRYAACIYKSYPEIFDENETCVTKVFCYKNDVTKPKFVEGWCVDREIQTDILYEDFDYLFWSLDYPDQIIFDHRPGMIRIWTIEMKSGLLCPHRDMDVITMFYGNFVDEYPDTDCFQMKIELLSHTWFSRWKEIFSIFDSKYHQDYYRELCGGSIPEDDVDRIQLMDYPDRVIRNLDIIDSHYLPSLHSGIVEVKGRLPRYEGKDEVKTIGYFNFPYKD